MARFEVIFVVISILGLSNGQPAVAPETRQYTIDDSASSGCIYSLDVTADLNGMVLELSDDCSVFSHQSTFDSSHEDYPFYLGLEPSGMLDLIDASISNEVGQEYADMEISIDEVSGEIEMVITADFFVIIKEIEFDFVKRSVSQEDLIDMILVLNNKINELKSYAAVLVYEELTGNRQRNAGWQTIVLDKVSHSDPYIYLNAANDGGIVLEPGVYNIASMINVHRTAHTLSRITSASDSVVPFENLYGSPIYARDDTSGSDSSLILPRRVVIDESTTVYLRLWIDNTRSNGGLFDGGFLHDYPNSVASVSITKVA